MTRTNAQRRRAVLRRQLVAKQLLNAPRVTRRLRITRRRRQPNRTRGILANLGNLVYPGVGGAIGQFADNFISSQNRTTTPRMINRTRGNMGLIAPTAFSGRTVSAQVNSTEEQGIEQLATVTIPAGTPAGTVILQALIAAPELGVRLATIAQLWSNTVFHHFLVEAVPANSTTVPGNYTLAIDPDPVQSYPSGANIPARLMALTSAVQSNAWARAAVEMLPNLTCVFNRFQPAGASAAELRQYAVGQVILATTTNYETDCEYAINIHWHVTFTKPDTTTTDTGNPPTFIVNTLGKPYSVINNEALSAPIDIFNNRPPNGIYQIPLGSLNVTINTSQFPSGVSVRVASIIVDATNTVTIGILDTSNIFDSLFGEQNPSTYVLNRQPAVMSKTGLATHSAIYGRIIPNNYLEWSKVVQVVKQKREHDRLVRKALERRLAAEFDSLSITDLQSRLVA